ncbi:MAG: TonB-dependent receptor [Vicinamibacterales bacterium]
MTTQFTRRLIALAASSLLVWVAAVPAAAQTTTTNSGIEGRVVDDTNATLPGVTVTISSPALQSQPETFSAADGRYRFTTLPGGTYTVRFQLTGFKTVERSNVQLSANFVATIDAKMELGGIEETITVTGQSPVVDTRTVAAVATIKSDAWELLPSSRSYEDMGKLAPGIRVSGIPDVGGSKTGGGRGSLINYGTNVGGSTLMFDGVNTDGVAGYYDVGAIEEMVVRAAGNDPEIATPGMTFQTIVRSGGNQFHGMAFGAFQTRGMQGDNITDKLRAARVTAGNPMDHYFDVNASLGGRLIRDKLWFFTSIRNKEYVDEPIGFARDPGPDGLWWTGDEPAGQVKNSESSGKKPSGVKLKYQLTDKQSLSYMHYANTKYFDGNDADQNHNGDSVHPQVHWNQIYNAEYTYTPWSNGIINAAFGNAGWHSRHVPADTVGANTLQSNFDTVTLRWTGPGWDNKSAGVDEPTPTGNKSYRYQWFANYTHFVPRWLGVEHDIKTGVYFAQDAYNRFQRRRSADEGGSDNDYLAVFANGTPVEVVTYNSPFQAKNSVSHQSWYIRDNFRVGDKLTLNAGLRIERYHVYLPAQSKEAGQFSQAADFAYKSLYDWRDFAPRFGLSYAINDKTVVKAAWGQFNFAIRADTAGIVRPFNLNDHTQRRYRWNDLNGDKIFQGTFNQQTGQVGGEFGNFIGTDPGTGSSSQVLNRDLKQPRTDEFTLFLERELMGALSARLGYVYKVANDRYQVVNLERPFEAFNVPVTVRDPGADGVLNTGDDGDMVTYYDLNPANRGRETLMAINPDGFNDRYHNIDVALTKRLSSGYQYAVSYLGTKRNAFAGGVFPMDPNAASFFPKDQSWEHTFRASGSVQLPLGLMTSSVFEVQSGTAQARDVQFRTGLPTLSSLTLRMEPLGSLRLPAVKLLNVRAAKRFTIRQNHTVTVEWDLFNALNSNAATNMTRRSGPNFNRINAILPPRVMRLGMVYAF